MLQQLSQSINFTIMKLLVGAVCFALTVVVSALEIPPAHANTVFGYHVKYGIPEARRIRNSELLKISGGQVQDVKDIPYQVCVNYHSIFFLTVETNN